jgi:hypothetical protein
VTPQRAARRAALDHVLALIADSPSVDCLVLRGSMTMLGWVGDRAREPGDLDWIVRPTAILPPDDRNPYPYVDHLDSVQTWPEMAHGAGRNKMWTFEDYDTGGFAPRLPPEGLRWLRAEDLGEDERPHERVIGHLREHPHGSNGLLLDADAVTQDFNFSYAAAYDPADGSADYPGTRGARIIVPWRTADGLHGTVQLDFAYDETLPEPPRLLAVPREDTTAPTAVWAATPELSLAWKLLWLGSDQLNHGRSAGKDLYDAVLLAELTDAGLSGRLRRSVLTRLSNQDIIAPAAVRRWVIDWSGLEDDPRLGPESSARWLERLATALPTCD